MTVCTAVRIGWVQPNQTFTHAGAAYGELAPPLERGNVLMQITLIGAGFCGSALAVELLRQGGPDTRVTLVGQPETFGRGVA
jgi:hypothetical protein